MAELGKQPELRDYLAAERTLLAWIRTGVACMGFGFVVARFGIFLQQFQIVRNGGSARPYGFSLWLGTALLAVGVLTIVVSAWQHARLVQRLSRGEISATRPSIHAVVLALFLALIGLGMVIYLIWLQGERRSAGDNKEISMTAAASSGILNKPSNHSVDETVEKITGILQAKGVTLFALVDHSGEAEKVGMKMPPTKLLIFGNPKAGTPVMLAAPSSAIDLPLKLLVWQDAKGKAWVSYNSPAYLQERHGIPQELMQILAVVEMLATKAGE